MPDLVSLGGVPVPREFCVQNPDGSWRKKTPEELGIAAATETVNEATVATVTTDASQPTKKKTTRKKASKKQTS